MKIACYNSSSGVKEAYNSTGYDADYSGNQPSYTVSADGLTVLDNYNKAHLKAKHRHQCLRLG